MFGAESEITRAPVVVVSYYDRRPDTDLLKLLESMCRFKAGVDFDVQVVVNRAVGVPIELPDFSINISVDYRENTGMNIGAWDHGWRINKGRPAYLFIQDECVVKQDGWLRAFLDRLEEPGVGMVGESLNRKWDKPWNTLKDLNLGVMMPDHLIEGTPADRVSVYLHYLKRWKVEPGPSGLHLRSLVWGLSGQTIERLNGFPIGRNYGECIASEIAVGRKVSSWGDKLVQVADRDFEYIWHSEWNQDFPGSPYTHSKARPKAAGYDLPGVRQRFDAEMESLAARLFTMSEMDRNLKIESLLLRLQDKEKEISELRAQIAANRRH